MFINSSDGAAANSGYCTNQMLHRLTPLVLAIVIGVMPMAGEICQTRCLAVASSGHTHGSGIHMMAGHQPEVNGTGPRLTSAQPCHQHDTDLVGTSVAPGSKTSVGGATSAISLALIAAVNESAKMPPPMSGTGRGSPPGGLAPAFTRTVSLRI